MYNCAFVDIWYALLEVPSPPENNGIALKYGRPSDAITQIVVKFQLTYVDWVFILASDLVPLEVSVGAVPPPYIAVYPLPVRA